MYKWLVLLIVPILLIGVFYSKAPQQTKDNISTITPTSDPISTPTPDPSSPLYLETLVNRVYPATDIQIEKTLTSESNYKRYIASYLSDGYKINGLLTIPNGDKPEEGFPSIIFLHGYLNPKTYQTTARYVAYQDGFARNGFITFKPDLRGHGTSEGEAVNSHFSQIYVIDTLNLISALKKYKEANPKLIGIWGHSNGGGITMRVLTISPDIKAAVIWAGVVGSYEDMIITYRNQIPWMNGDNFPYDLIQKYGQPSQTSPFWSKIDSYSYISNITAPVQLHHGTADKSVPIELSRHFSQVLEKNTKSVELFEYPNGDHNIASPHFAQAMERSITFFKKYLQ